MAIELLIGSTDRVAVLDTKDNPPNIRMSRKIRGQTFMFDLVYPGDTSSADFPLAGQIVSFTIDGTKHFGGQLLETLRRYNQPNSIRFTCSAGDYTALFDKYIIAPQSGSIGWKYGTQTAGLMMRSIVNLFTLSEFPTGNINTLTSPIIGEQTFSASGLSEAVERIVRLCPPNWVWYIDYSKSVYFVDGSVTPGPVSSFDLDAGTNWSGLEYGESVSPIANQIFLDGVKMRSSEIVTVNIQGNGAQDTWPLHKEPWPDKDTFIPKIDGATQTVGWDGYDTDKEAYICPLNQGIRFATPPADGSVITVEFPYIVDMAYQVQDVGSWAIMAAREGGDGIHQSVFDLGQAYITNTETVADYGAALLQQSARLKYPARIRVMSTALWLPGHSTTLTGTKLGISKFMYVQEVTKKLFRDNVNNQWMWDQTLSLDAVPDAWRGEPIPLTQPLPRPPIPQGYPPRGLESL